MTANLGRGVPHTAIATIWAVGLVVLTVIEAYYAHPLNLGTLGEITAQNVAVGVANAYWRGTTTYTAPGVSVKEATT